MGGYVLVPWERNRENAPAGLDVAVFDGHTKPPEASVLERVEFYVLPYVHFDREAARSSVRLLGHLPRLRAVQTLTAGYDHLVGRLPPDVTLCNGRGLHDASTAEHALALLLAAQRELPRWFAAQQRRVWEPEATGSLADSRVLIVGYGSIGAAIERRLLACDAEVVRVARHARPDEDVHPVAELPDLLPGCDIVVLVAPLTEDTRGLLGPRELGLLPDGALVVNVGRGPVLDTAALRAEQGRIRAALDVTDPEPLPSDDPLWTTPGVVITPHVAGGSATFYPRARRFVDTQLQRWATGQQLHNVVM
ncbi:2-hydroxyacid dehydrogenase [Lipingzhangella sp. LS1_29]|uniref:2-hydroxyacid dehydrogenase n=1 Tax=Lipingzhangella rawalii TaxID=2055835 RepID=A0ABU2H6Q2_9ACTN|nr:2-hydroxyacid dehydrogenase [Lipingzhangella rawalii]MDS1270966.1 2-hydroxyacid dehydrogenase [Lipingzhangella rawalii]